jgi:hypothetical protein
MKRRAFRMRDHRAALAFLNRLLESGTSVQVECSTSGIDVCTPFELQPDLFPETEWLAK